MITEDLNDLFDREMNRILLGAEKVLGKRLSIFRAMLDEYRGVESARKLLAMPLSDGFTDLVLVGRLDLTVEAEIYKHPEWHDLFKKEMPEIQKRLGIKQ